jgi:hypothetical protein
VSQISDAPLIFSQPRKSFVWFGFIILYKIANRTNFVRLFVSMEVIACAIFVGAVIILSEQGGNPPPRRPEEERNNSTSTSYLSGWSFGGSRAGGGTRRQRAGVNDDDEEEDDDSSSGRRKRRIVCSDVGVHDINGKLQIASAKEDAKLFRPTKNGPGGFVRTMKPEQAKVFLQFHFALGPKNQSLMQFINELHEQEESYAGSEGSFMPKTFPTRWPMIRRMMGSGAAGNQALENVLFAKFSSGNLSAMPLLECAPLGAEPPPSLRKESWLSSYAPGVAHPARTPEGRQYILTLLQGLMMVYMALWHEAFEGSLEPIMRALSGGDAIAANLMMKMSDLYILLLIHGVLARWSTAMWTQLKGVAISPESAAERLKGAMQDLVDNVCNGAYESFPHHDFFGEGGRFLTIMAATFDIELEKERSRASSEGGGGKPLTSSRDVSAGMTAAAVATSPYAAPPGLSAWAADLRQDREKGLFGSRKKGLCLKCVLRIMDVDHDRRACGGEAHLDHPTNLRDVPREDVLQTVQKFLPRTAKGYDEAAKWIASNFP